MENLDNYNGQEMYNNNINCKDIFSNPLLSLLLNVNKKEFQRRTREEYILIHNLNIEKRKNQLSQIKDENCNFQLDSPIDLENYNPLGKNIEIDFKEIKIKDLNINEYHYKRYLVLKIISKLLVVKSTTFLCQDSNKDVINVSIYNSELYFNVKGWDQLEKEIYNEGKYIIVIEPYFKIYMSGYDGLRIEYPNEIILFNNKEDLNYFLDKKNQRSPENYKLIGNLMMKNGFYEKSIYYYNEAINKNNIKKNNITDIILHSNLTEAYIKYGYFTRAIQNADYCLNKINELLKNKNKEKENILSQQRLKALYRKIKALISLRKFKESYNILFNVCEEDINKDLIAKFLQFEEVKNIAEIIRNGYKNNLRYFNFKKMVEDEKININLDKYGDYLNPKIEINFKKGKGISLLAKEKFEVGELILVEKALVFSQKGNNILENSNDKPSIILEIDLYNKLSEKMAKYPLDNEKFYYLYNGNNLNEDICKRKKYLELQETGKKKLTKEKVNGAIIKNKYGSGRFFIFYNEICSGVWGYASLINHDCLPNTTYLGIGDFYILFCIREINKGEEITSNYYSSSISFEERQKILLKSWGFKCSCQLCEYQEKKNDIDYNNYIKLFTVESMNKISLKDAQLFENFLQKNKKKYSCYELANGYLQLEKYYCQLNDLNNTKKFSDLVNRYAEGKNYIFELSNLNTLLCILGINSKEKEEELFIAKANLIKMLKKYTPFNIEEIQYFIDDNIKQHNMKVYEKKREINNDSYLSITFDKFFK